MAGQVPPLGKCTPQNIKFIKRSLNVWQVYTRTFVCRQFSFVKERFVNVSLKFLFELNAGSFNYKIGTSFVDKLWLQNYDHMMFKFYLGKTFNSKRFRNVRSRTKTVDKRTFRAYACRTFTERLCSGGAYAQLRSLHGLWFNILQYRRYISRGTIIREGI